MIGDRIWVASVVIGIVTASLSAVYRAHRPR
jgi:hypothetical protein